MAAASALRCTLATPRRQARQTSASSQWRPGGRPPTSPTPRGRSLSTPVPGYFEADYPIRQAAYDLRKLGGTLLPHGQHFVDREDASVQRPTPSTRPRCSTSNPKTITWGTKGVPE